MSAVMVVPELTWTQVAPSELLHTCGGRTNTCLDVHSTFVGILLLFGWDARWADRRKKKNREKQKKTKRTGAA